MYSKSIIAIITYIKDDKFYVFGTLLGKLKALYRRKLFILCKNFFLNIQDFGIEEIRVREVVNKLSLVGDNDSQNETVQKIVPGRCVSANQSVDFVFQNDTTFNLAVTSQSNYDLTILEKILNSKFYLSHEILLSFNKLIR